MRQTLSESIQLRVPAGFRAAVAEIAAREHVTPSCYLHRLALMHVEGRHRSADADTGRCSVPHHAPADGISEQVS